MTKYVEQRLKELGITATDLKKVKSKKSIDWTQYLRDKAEKRVIEVRKRREQRKALLIGQTAQNRPYTALLQPHENTRHPTVAALGANNYSPPYKNLVNTGVCTYCGRPAQCKDHVIPVCYTTVGRRKKRLYDVKYLVDSCSECNTFLGKLLIPTVVDRAAYLFRTWKVRKRYSWDRLEHLEKVALSG
jgi:hypothetical protein